MKTRIFLVYGACLLLAVTLFPVRAWALPFSSATIYSTGVNPWKVVTGDWNRDGKLDAATSNAGDDTISVFLNDGLGNLTNNLNDSTCSRPYGMAAADFDSDGWTDLAVSCDGANKVSVFLNRADGTGNFFHGTESAAGNEPRGLVAYDFDGDGSMDLAMADFVGGVDVALGKGDGTFAASTPYASGLYSTDVTVGDFDNDNNVDLVVTNSCAGCFVPYGTGSVSFLSGNGDGTFNATVNTPTTRGSVSVTSDDFDGDGNRDLAIVKPRHNLMSIFTGNGDGTFNATPDLATDAGPQAITSGDVNQDGKTDILVSNSTANKFSVYTGNGNGWFNSPSTTTAGTTPLGLALGDFNRDGKLDLALANEADNTLAVYFDASPPAITALTPNSTSVGGNGIAVTITGTGFAPNSKGRVNGSDRPTTYVSPTSLSVNIGQSDVERNGTLNFTVYNPALSLTSNSSTFTVTGSSNGGGGLPPEAFLPPAQPEGGFKILLDGGAAQTGSRQVQVTFVTDAGMRVPAAKSFAISNVADFSGASILPLPSSALNWDLCAQAGGAIVPSACATGEHTVYVKFYSAWGQASPAVSAKIQYGNAPANPLPPLSQTPPASTLATIASAPRFTFNRTLKFGMNGTDVRELQRFLNAQGFTLTASGPGSAGNETQTFGPATQNALKRYQAAHADQVLKPLGLTLPTGILGPATRALINGQ